MFEPKDVRAAQCVATDDGRRRVRSVAVVLRRMTLALAAGLVLGACAIPFGNGTESPDQPSQETRRDRSRRYQEEQERIERERTFNRVGPSDR